MNRFTLGLSGGYRAGHILPMIALAESWRRVYPDDEVLCFGSADGIEAELIPQFKLPFQSLPAHPFLDDGAFSYIRAGFSALRGMLAGCRHKRGNQRDGATRVLADGSPERQVEFPLGVPES